MLLLAGEQVDGLVLAVWPAALSLRHRVALAPDHLAAEEPARVAHADHEAVGEGEQVPVPQPRLPGVQEGLPAVPGLHVRGVRRVETGPAGTECAVGVVPGTPVHRGVVRVADVEPEQPVRLQLGQQRPEDRGELGEVGPRVGLDSVARGRALAPVRRAGHRDVDALVRQVGDQFPAVALGDLVQREPSHGRDGHARSRSLPIAVSGTLPGRHAKTRQAQTRQAGRAQTRRQRASASP